MDHVKSEILLDIQFEISVWPLSITAARVSASIVTMVHSVAALIQGVEKVEKSSLLWRQLNLSHNA